MASKTANDSSSADFLTESVLPESISNFENTTLLFLLTPTKRLLVFLFIISAQRVRLGCRRGDAWDLTVRFFVRTKSLRAFAQSSVCILASGRPIWTITVFRVNSYFEFSINYYNWQQISCNFAWNSPKTHCTYFISGSAAARWRSMAIFFSFSRAATAATTTTGAVGSSSSFQIAHAPCVRTSTATCLQQQTSQWEIRKTIAVSIRTVVIIVVITHGFWITIVVRCRCCEYRRTAYVYLRWFTSQLYMIFKNVLCITYFQLYYPNYFTYAFIFSSGKIGYS